MSNMLCADNLIVIATDDYDHVMSIVAWCKETFVGTGNGKWELYESPMYNREPKYELVITPQTDDVGMLIKLRWA